MSFTQTLPELKKQRAKADADDADEIQDAKYVSMALSYRKYVPFIASLDPWV